MTVGEPVAVLTDHLRRIEGPWRVGFDLGPDERLLVDCPAGTVTTRRAGDCTDCDVTVPRRELLALLAGDLDPRAAFMYQKATVTGPMRPAVELLDALAGNGVTHEPILAHLPRPTTDRGTAQGDLDRAGYCIVADALSPNCSSASAGASTSRRPASGRPGGPSSKAPEPTVWTAVRTSDSTPW